jgi:hypothetical protein
MSNKFRNLAYLTLMLAMLYSPAYRIFITILTIKYDAKMHVYEARE